jgi:hypothetical protein
MRELNERIEFCEKQKAHAESKDDLIAAENWRNAREETAARLDALQRVFCES